VKRKKMNARKSILALFLVAMMLSVAMPITMPSEDAGSSVTVIGVPCEIKSVAVDPTPVTLAPGRDDTDMTVTAVVTCGNGVGHLKAVEITEIDPYHTDDEHFLKAFPRPMKMKPTDISTDGVSGVYSLTIPLGYCLEPGDYTITVTATCKDGLTSTGTGTFTIASTLAISVTDVNFGSVAPGKSGEGYAKVTKMGNVPLKFAEPDGIVPSDMLSGAKGIINAKDIAVNWDWSTILICRDSVDAGFTLSVPYGTEPGTYTGRIVFTPIPAK
jgi:hypothetical protein